MKKLGKHKTGKSCLYIKKLDDVDMDVLTELVSRSVACMRANYDCDQIKAVRQIKSAQRAPNPA